MVDLMKMSKEMRFKHTKNIMLFNWCVHIHFHQKNYYFCHFKTRNTYHSNLHDVKNAYYISKGFNNFQTKIILNS